MSKYDDFCTKNEEFCTKNKECFILKMMNFAEHLAGPGDGNMPPAPRETDFDEPWIESLPLVSVEGSDKEVGRFHVAVRDSKDGAFHAVFVLFLYFFFCLNDDFDR